MENLLKELRTSMKPCDQAERIQKAHQVRKQEWVKQRRDDINEPNGKRRRTNHHAGVSEDNSFASVDSKPVVADTSTQHSVYAVTVPTGKQPNTL
jgi:hypothetical protein